MKEQNRIWNSFVHPFFWVSILWLIHYLQYKSDVYWTDYGIYPRSIKGLRGILFSPFLHGDFKHLISNSVPLVLLGWALVYFYREAAHRVFIFVFLFSGMGTWLIGRDSFHIGASSLVYGFSFFLFVSGAVRKNTRLSALSLLVVFIYGGLVWGLLPIIERMSWEGHLAGSIGGVMAAFIFRNVGPQRKIYEWEKDDDDAYVWDGEKYILRTETDVKDLPAGEDQPMRIHYIYKKEKNNGEKD